ncbi:MAG: WD40 repeat domain-containing protein [Saprospiraceae bacterium]
MNKLSYSVLTLLLATILCNTTILHAQSCDYQQFMAEGKAAFDAGDYQIATNKFKAANVCCQREKVTNCEAEQWIIRSQETYVNALQAEKEKLELASKAYRYANDNPTHAFRIAEYAITKNPGNKAAREQYLNLLKTHPFPFYASIMTHEDYISSCAVSPGGDLIATAGWDNKVQLWDKTGQLLRSFGQEGQAHQEPVLSVAFSPDGKHLLSAGMDNQAILWNLNGEVLAYLRGHEGDITDAIFSPDGNLMASASWDGTIKWWNLQGEEVRTINAHENFISDIDFSSNGELASASWDKTVKIWSREGQLKHTLVGKDAYFTSVDFSPDGKSLLTTGWDSRVLRWDIATENITQEYSGHTGIVHQALFSPSSQYILSCGADNTVRLWNLQGNQIQAFNYHEGPIRAIAFSPDDQYFVTGGEDGKAASWYYHGYQDHLYRFEALKTIQDVCYNPVNQNMLFSSGTKAYLCGMDGKITKILEGHQYDIERTYISADGQYMLTGSLDVYLYDAKGDTVCVYKKHRALIHDLAMATNKKLVISGGRDDLFSLWNFKGEQIFAKMLVPGIDITRVAFSPMDDFVVAGTANGKVFVVDLEGNILQQMNSFEGWVMSIALSPDAKRIAVGNTFGDIKIWSPKGALLEVIPTTGSRVTSMAFSSDAKHLLIGRIDGEAELRNEDGRIIQQFVGHRASINKVLFMDDQNILTTSNDGTIRKWRTIQSLMADQKIYTLSPRDSFNYGFEGIDTTHFQQVLVDERETGDIANIERQIFDSEKNYFENGEVKNLQFAAFYYSKKAHLSRNLEEKILLQKRALAYHDAFGLTANEYQKAFLCSKLALWYMAQKDIIQAQKYMDQAFSYKMPEIKPFQSIRGVLALRKAILHIYLDDWDTAKPLILEHVYYVPPKGQDAFPQLYYLTSNQLLSDGASLQHQLMEDLAFLTAAGAGHPNFEKVEKLLQP